MLPATVGPVYWKMITYCVPNDKSAQWHVALLSSPDPSLIVSVVSFLYPTLALICWNDSPHIRGTNRMPSASLSLSSLHPERPPSSPPSAPLPSRPSSPQKWGNQRSLGGRRGCKCSLRSGPCVCRLSEWHHRSRESAAHVLEHLACASKKKIWSDGGVVRFSHSVSAGALTFAAPLYFSLPCCCKLSDNIKKYESSSITVCWRRGAQR